MLSWENFPQKLAAPLSGILPLINAVNERSVIPVFTPIAQFNKLDELDGLNIIQNRITNLIPKFVNHLDNGGNWQGKAAIPNWTETSIMAAIGEERLAPPQILHELSTEWLLQQKKIINLLLWYKTTTFAIVDSSGYFGSTWPNSYTSVTEAVNVAIANKADNGGFIGNYSSASPAPVPNGTKYGSWIETGQGKYEFSAIPGDTLNSAVDVYFLAGAYGDFDGAGIVIEGMNLISSLPVGVYSSYTTPLIGNRNPIPVYPATPFPATGNTALGWSERGGNFISKFNVPGGFEYVEET